MSAVIATILLALVLVGADAAGFIGIQFLIGLGAACLASMAVVDCFLPEAPR